MDLGQFLLVALAGLVAGSINAVVGSGTLITYPVLLSLGLSPVVANGTNSVGLSVGGVASAVPYAPMLRPRARILLLPTLLAMAGGALGAWLVVSLPAKVFTAIVPWLIISAVALVAFQPLIAKALRQHPRHPLHRAKDLPFWATVMGTYGGYFGAGQGVMYMAILGLRYDDDIQQVNAAKNLLGSLANIAAACVFIVTGFMSWPFAIALWGGSIAGGYFGSHGAQRIPRTALRIIVMAVGLYAAGYLFVTSR